jgi:hypothetical protein
MVMQHGDAATFVTKYGQFWMLSEYIYIYIYIYIYMYSKRT